MCTKVYKTMVHVRLEDPKLMDLCVKSHNNINYLQLNILFSKNLSFVVKFLLIFLVACELCALR
jgi:hypothetical protein